VVATGLGQAPRQVQPNMKVVQRTPTGEVDYTELDKPAVIRKQAVGDHYVDPVADQDYLDIPAFLRRQAD
jgi:cell division protein FtsZ